MSNPNWGGWREGAGRKRKLVGWGEEMSPHSVYCSGMEIEYIRAFLPRLRKYRALLSAEPVPQNEDQSYKGTHDEWEKELEELENGLRFDNLMKDVNNRQE